MSKHAVLSFTECLYLEMQLKQAPISVSAVLPAQVATRIFSDAAADRESSFVQKQRAILDTMLEKTGLQPEEAAAIILDGIAAGQFWVSTHPETTKEMAEGRARHLSELTPPRLAVGAQALLNAAS